MKYWKGRTGTPKAGHFGTMDDDGSVPDSDICTKSEYDTYVASIPIQSQSVEPITRNLKVTSNIYELNTDC